jgi:tungstate transport system ATP-binding protein
VITVKNLRHRYGERVVVNIDALEITRGEIAAIVGPSGAGKSTLMRLLALLEPPTEGSIQININGGQVSSDTVSIEERRQMVMVFQRPSLLSRSVYDNVAYSLRIRGNGNIHEKVMQVLQRVDMQSLANVKPRQLSGGELQRVAIARALVLNPALLVLDEPTANLDPANIRLLEELFTEQNEQHGTTILIVTHNIFQARRLARRVGLMIGGELVEISDVDTFFNHPQDARTSAFVSGDFVY